MGIADWQTKRKYAAIANPTPEDLITAARSMMRAGSNEHVSNFVEDYAPKVQGWNVDSVISLSNSFQDDGSKLAIAVAGFTGIKRAGIERPAPADLADLIMKLPASQMNDAVKHNLVETLTPWVRTNYGALAKSLADNPNVTGRDLAAAVLGTHSNGKDQLELITTYAPKIADLDDPYLQLALDSMNSRFYWEETQKARARFKSLKASRASGKPSTESLQSSSSPSQPNQPKVDLNGNSSRGSTTSFTALDELKGMSGMEKVAEQLGKIKNYLATGEQRAKEGLKVPRPTLHVRFDGNPGTGKTTVARIYAKMLRELGYLKGAAGNKEVPFVERGGADFSTHEAVENMKKAIKEAQGGVLLLDEIYTADVAKNNYAKDAMAILLKEMEDNRDKFVVIATGYSKEMDAFISSNDGFRRRFAQKVNFEDYDDAVLSKILKKVAGENDYHMDDNVVQSVIQKLSRQRGKGFGNAGTVRNEFEAAIQRHGVRLSKHPNPTTEELKRLTLEDFGEASNSSIDEKLSALDKIVGLDDVKKNIRSVVSLLRLEKSEAEHGIKSERPLLNSIFEGNPGTGKTTVGKMYGSLLKDLGYVSNGEFVYVKASDLIGDVVGASEKQTKDILKRAKGNVLFIDEAYRLYQPNAGGGGSNSFGKAALDTLVEEINPDANQDMVVILGGYSREMANMLTANSGLSRRFPNTFHFADYTPEQLTGILLKKAKEKGLELSPEAQKAALSELNLRRSAKDFGNAGEVENLLGAARLRRSQRLAETGKTQFTAAELKEIRPEDIQGPRKSPNEILKQLDSIPGLANVKRTLHDIKDTYEEAALADLDPQALGGGAYTFEGHSPEEQKKVAEVLGELLHSQGVLPKKTLEVADSADLKGQYIGESAAKTRRLLENSLGKTLIIKDLGAISNSHNPYEKEAIETITSFLQQNHGKLAVVFSGTPEEVKRFTSLNPQIARRIEHVLEFHDLSAKDSVAYMCQLFHGAGKSLSPAAENKLNEAMSHLLAEPSWGNAKNLESFKARILIKQAVRNKRNPGADATLIEADDVEAAMPHGLLRRQTATSDHAQRTTEVDSSANMDTGKTREMGREQEAVATESQAASSNHEKAQPKQAIHEHVHEHEHEHAHEHASVKGHQLSEFGIHISEKSQKVMNGLEDILDPKDANAVEEMKQSIRQGNLSPQLLEQLAKKLQIPLDAKSLSRLSADAAAAIQEMKRGAKILEERARTDAKAKKLIKHYVCLACGRSSCRYMPYNWFT